MTERTQDVEGRDAEILEWLDEHPSPYDEVADRIRALQSNRDEARESAAAARHHASEATLRYETAEAERDEAERLAREWTNMPPENFKSLPRKASLEILCYGMFLYAKGLREKLQDAHNGWAASDEQLGRAEAALSRKDAALRSAAEGLGVVPFLYSVIKSGEGTSFFVADAVVKARDASAKVARALASAPVHEETATEQYQREVEALNARWAEPGHEGATRLLQNYLDEDRMGL